MKCPFRINRVHTSNGYNSSDTYEFADCYEENCPFYKVKDHKDTCKRTDLDEGNKINISE